MNQNPEKTEDFLTRKLKRQFDYMFSKRFPFPGLHTPTSVLLSAMALQTILDKSVLIMIGASPV